MSFEAIIRSCADHADDRQREADAQSRAEELLAQEFLAAALDDLSKPAAFAPIKGGLYQMVSAVLDDTLDYGSFRLRALSILNQVARNGNEDARELFSDMAQMYASMNAGVCA